MPRQLRQFEVGSVYHVINRGVDKRKIFLNNQDYSRFILALEFFNNVSLVNLWDLFFNTRHTVKSATTAGSDPAVVGRKI